MQVVQVPENRRVLAINFKRVECFVAARVARRFKRRQRSVREPREKSAGVIDADLLDFAGEVVLALSDKRFRHGVDFVDGAVKPHRRVDAVREKVAGDA